MSKLPPEFVKAPPAQPAPRARRARKTSIVAAEPPPDPRELVLHLTDDELQALEEVRLTLQRAGEDVTLAQIVHRVIAEWRLYTTRATEAAEAAEPAEPAPRDARILDRLLALAAAPLRTWRELGATLRRLSGLPAR